MNIIAIGRPTHLAVNRSTACGLVGAVFSKTDDPRKVDCLRCRRTRIARATLTLNAAITHLEELHQLGAEMVATTGARPESLDSTRPFFELWENRFEKLTGTDYFTCRTQHLPK